MRAIETHYNGHRFRSRLEARWAVFFDTAGIAYRYEPEGFELSDGSRYLPDFHLSDHDVYVEVKGGDVVPEDDWARMVRFAHDRGEQMGGTRVHLVVLGDLPRLDGLNIPHHRALVHKRHDDSATYTGTVTLDDPADNLDGQHCLRHDLIWLDCADEDCDHRLLSYGRPTQKWSNPRARNIRAADAPVWAFGAEWSLDDPLRLAYIAARRARFEFGQTPRAIR